MARTVRVGDEPSRSWARTLVPMCQLDLFALSWDTAMPLVPSLATSPACTCMSTRDESAAVSVAETRVPSPSIVAGAYCIAATFRTDGSAAMRETSASGMPLPVLVTTTSPRNPVSTSLLIEATAEAANTEIAQTRVAPIISADAVEAVRRGFRSTFSWPR